MPAYIKRPGRIPNIDFCFCLTCHKGFIGDETSPRGSRWVNEHENKKACVAAHPVALAAFKERQKIAMEERARRETVAVAETAATLVPVTPTVMTVTPVPPTVMPVTPTVTLETKSPFHIVWEFIKQHYPASCVELENEAAELAEEDSEADDEFDPKEGILDLMKQMRGYKKHFEKQKTEIDAKNHEIALRDGRIRILEENCKDYARRFRKEEACTDSDSDSD